MLKPVAILKKKLTTLNPRWTIGSRWVTPDGAQHSCGRGNSMGRFGMGVTFDCPLHKTHRITVFFANPVDGLPPEDGAALWQRSGERFESLTASPAFDSSQSECWRGFITKGEIT